MTRSKFNSAITRNLFGRFLLTISIVWISSLGIFAQVGQQIQNLDPNYGNSGGSAGGSGMLYTEIQTIDMSLTANQSSAHQSNPNLFELVETGGCPTNPSNGCSGIYLGAREMCDGSTEGPDYQVVITNIEAGKIKTYSTVSFTICRRGDYGHIAEKVYVVDENDTVIAFVDSSGGGSTSDCTPEQQCVTATISGCDYSDLAADGTISLGIHCPGGNRGTTAADCDAVCNSTRSGRRDGDYDNDGILDGNCVELTKFSVAITTPDVGNTISSTSPCVGQSVTLTPNSNSAPFNQKWTVNGSNIGSGTQTWTPSAQGTYTICNIVGNGTCEEEDCTIVTVSKPPTGQNLTLDVCAESDFNPYDYASSINPGGSGTLYLFTDNTCTSVIQDNTTFNISGGTAFPANPSSGGTSNAPMLSAICSDGSTPVYNSMGGNGTCTPPSTITTEGQCMYYGGTWTPGGTVTIEANKNTNVEEANPTVTWTLGDKIEIKGKLDDKLSALFGFDDVNNTSVIPAGATITSAMLKLTIQADPNPSLDISINEMTSGWTLATAHWNNTINNYNTTAAATHTVLKDDTSIMLDITSLVSQWYTTGTNHGLMVRPNQTLNEAFKVYSNDISNASNLRPNLIVTYTGGGVCSGASTVTNTTTALCSSNNGTFTGTPADQMSQTIKYIISDNGCTSEGTVTFNVSNSDPILSASTTDICEGENVTITAPFGAASYDFFVDDNPENGMKDAAEFSLSAAYVSNNIATIPTGTGTPLPTGTTAIGVVIVSSGFPCEGTGTIDITVEQAVISNNVALTLCDDTNADSNADEDGSATFTLADAEDNSATSNLNSGTGEDVDNGATGITVSYYPTMADAEAKTTNTLSATYTTVSSPDVVYARVENDMTGCYSVSTVTLNVESPAQLGAGLDFVMCTGDVVTLGGASMNTPTASWSIQSGTGGTLSDENPTANPEAVTFTSGTVGNFVLRLTSANPTGSCPAEIRDLNVTVNGSPTASNTTIYSCENTDPTADKALFDL
ncbi:MAG: DNRLRE domain-containing protein, partial [Bacteroidia bacterium]|nr:DNRLRE domain-containing protein [Bacteroidia bacterium]